MGLRQEVVEQGRLATAEEARQHLGFATVGTISTAVSFDAGLHRHRHAEVHRVHVLGHDSERKELDKGFGEGADAREANSLEFCFRRRVASQGPPGH